MKITIEGKQGEGKTTVAHLIIKAMGQLAMFKGMSIRLTTPDGIEYKSPRGKKKYDIEIVEKIG